MERAGPVKGVPQERRSTMIETEKSGGKNNRRRERKWKVKEVTVRFVPFKSEAQRNEAYRLWVRSIVKGIRGKT